jgi:hypothetical protein
MAKRGWFSAAVLAVTERLRRMTVIISKIKGNRARL